MNRDPRVPEIPPKRVRVTSPRRAAQRRAPVRPVASEVEEETGLGELYVDSLVRTQLTLSVAVLAGMVIVVGGLPIVFLLVPSVHDLRIAGVPLPWLVLTVLLYPFAAFVAQAYIRSAERVEREFTELMRR